MHHKGNLPSKFQLNRIKHFGGVSEQTNKQTDKLTDNLLLWKIDINKIDLHNAKSFKVEALIFYGFGDK